MTLKCVSDGVPTPTLTWYKPDRNELKKVTAKESTVKVTTRNDQDFGEYKCDADNGIAQPNFMIVEIKQISRSFCRNFKMKKFLFTASFNNTRTLRLQT